MQHLKIISAGRWVRQVEQASAQRAIQDLVPDVAGQAKQAKRPACARADGTRLAPRHTDVICWLCSPATSCACRPLRTSQKRSAPSKWPLAMRAPSG